MKRDIIKRKYLRSYLLILGIAALLGISLAIVISSYLYRQSYKQHQASISYLELTLRKTLEDQTEQLSAICDDREILWLSEHNDNNPAAVLARASISAALYRSEISNQTGIWFSSDTMLLTGDAVYRCELAQKKLPAVFDGVDSVWMQLLDGTEYCPGRLLLYEQDGLGQILYLQTAAAPGYAGAAPVLYSVLERREIRSLLSAYEDSSDTHCYLINADGEVFDAALDHLDDHLWGDRPYQTVSLALEGTELTLLCEIPKATLIRDISGITGVLLLITVILLTIGFMLAAYLSRRNAAPISRLTKLLQNSDKAEEMDYTLIEASLNGMIQHNQQLNDMVLQYQQERFTQQLRLALQDGIDADQIFPHEDYYIGTFLRIQNFGPQFDGQNKKEMQEQIEAAVVNVAQEMLRGHIYSCSMFDGLFMVLGCDQQAADSFANEIQALLIFFQELLEVQLYAVASTPFEGDPTAPQRCLRHCWELSQVYALLPAPPRLFTEADRISPVNRETVIPRYVNQLYSGDPTESNLEGLLSWCSAADSVTEVQFRVDTLSTITLDAANSVGVPGLHGWAQRILSARGTSDYSGAIRALWNAIAHAHHSAQTESQDVLVERLQHHLQEHFANQDLSIGQVARELNYNHSHMTRIYREKTGQSPIEYLTQLRLNRAKELLLKGQTIRDAAAQCGYLDGRALGVVFKKVEGISPTQWLATQTIAKHKST